ncbi:TPA: lytic transglycosylase domain-containing protein [bacterium]|nr:lytic transglycosylase domain-containing protein [bacterium]
MIESINNVLHRIEEIRQKINTYYYSSNGDISTSFKEVLETTVRDSKPKIQNLDPSGELAGLIERYSRKNRLDPDLVKAVIKTESNFNPMAVSPAGAKGLMQLMPQTAKELGVRNIFDIEENIAGGTKYLRQMLDRFNNNLSLALAAYNAGPDRVEKHNSIPNIKETQNYIKKVLDLYKGT